MVRGALQVPLYKRICFCPLPRMAYFCTNTSSPFSTLMSLTLFGSFS